MKRDAISPSLWGKVMPGSYVAIKLRSGKYTYGRLLDKLIAFYDVTSLSISSVSDLEGVKIAFIASVGTAGIKTKRWPVIGWKLLEDNLRQDVSFFFRGTSGDKFYIYISKCESLSAYSENEATPAQCVGLQPRMVWTMKLMEERLNMYFSGKVHPAVERESKLLEEALASKAVQHVFSKTESHAPES